MGDNGWRLTLTDMNYLAEHARREHPGSPTVLLGHSMGAALSQQYLYLYGQHLSAAVLSGSPGFGATWQQLLMQFICRLESLRSGPDMQSDFLQNTLFGNNNKPFEENADPESINGFEWLSKDHAQVQAYINDAQCGFVLSPASLAQMFAGMRQSAMPANVAAIKKNLPVYVLAGADDPVHREEAGLIKLVEAYRQAGLSVDYKLYPEGRHEMLNETNRVEVVAQLLEWLEGALVNS
jgi:alpha-beta hydrolase superfamily lysophospholipase